MPHDSNALKTHSLQIYESAHKWTNKSFIDIPGTRAGASHTTSSTSAKKRAQCITVHFLGFYFYFLLFIFLHLWRLLLYKLEIGALENPRLSQNFYSVLKK